MRYCLFFSILISAATYSSPYTCSSSAGCPTVAPTCDMYGLCSCYSGCTGPLVPLPTSSQQTIPALTTYYQIPFTAQTPLFVQPIISLNQTGGPLTQYNVYFLVFLDGSYTLLTYQTSQPLSPMLTVTLPPFQTPTLSSGQQSYILMVVQSSNTATILTISYDLAYLFSSNISVLRIILYVMGGGVMIASLIGTILCICRRRLQQEAQAQAMEKEKEGPKDISYFEEYMPGLVCTAQMNLTHEVCSVCLQELCVGQVVRRTPCGHYFHRECVDSWCLKHLNCPLCRSDLDVQTICKIMEEKQESLNHSVWVRNQLLLEEAEIGVGIISEESGREHLNEGLLYGDHVGSNGL